MVFAFRFHFRDHIRVRVRVHSCYHRRELAWWAFATTRHGGVFVERDAVRVVDRPAQPLLVVAVAVGVGEDGLVGGGHCGVVDGV